MKIVMETYYGAKSQVTVLLGRMKSLKMEILLSGFLKAQTAAAFKDLARETNGYHAMWSTA